ncbi:MAG TPA: hypothetical protein DHN29_21085 [Cytophagales bacterium]|nr:hypothetical protein [Cytophagales bacterium]|tara:strand:+ start:1559 stop:2251 length:693 start_codon:yes stop_codon:yes gene_type:complete
MCTATSQNLIETIVEEWIDEEKMFTAFEVSIEVKKRARSFGQPVERHRDMKNDIHRELSQYTSSGEYERKPVDVAPGVEAFVYHHADDDPDNYQNTVVVGTPKAQTVQPSQSAVVAAPVIPALSKPVTGNKAGKGTDARGSLTVPATELRKINAKPGDTVEVYFAGASFTGYRIHLSKKALNTQSGKTSYTVNKSNNFRITARTLKKANLTGPTYKFKGGSVGEIIVTDA